MSELSAMLRRKVILLMAERVDSQKARKLVIQAVGPHKSILVAREQGCDVIRLRDEVITICMPYAMRLARGLIRLPGVSRIEIQDIEGAALLGLVEGIDNFEYRRCFNGKPIQIQTHLWNRIRKRVNQERALGHWAIMRPPHAMVERYMSGNMTATETQSYIDMFVKPHAIPGDDDSTGMRTGEDIQSRDAEHHW